MTITNSLNITRFWTPSAKPAPVLVKTATAPRCSMDTLSSGSTIKSSGSADQIVLGAPIALEAKSTATGVPATKTFKGQMLTALKLAGKGATCVLIAPLVGLLGSVTLFAAAIAPVVGAVMGFGSVIVKGDAAWALIHGSEGFQASLDFVGNTSKSALASLTKFVGLTK